MAPAATGSEDDGGGSGAAAQLQHELHRSVEHAIATRRPILTHVNADTTWLLQLPWPSTASSSSSAAAAETAGRTYFNLLIDPWLDGPQSDVAAWFSTQWHAIPSSVHTIAELEQRLRAVEQIARGSSGKSAPSKADSSSSKSYIDAVAICHEFTDHCHEATLRQIAPTTPVFATEKAAALIQSWHHFDHVVTTPAFGPSQRDWRRTRHSLLPHWLGISRVVSPGNALYYHSALLIAVAPAVLPMEEKKREKGSERSEDEAEEEAEAIIYTPHGIEAADLAPVVAASPPLRTLALLHGLHRVWLPGKQLNLGGHNGLQAHQVVKPQYWVASHDEVKKGGGVVGYLLSRSVITLRDAVDRALGDDDEGREEREKGLADINFAEMESGESLLLE